jgi:hypothetical protein
VNAHLLYRGSVNYFVEIDGRIMPVLFRAKAVLACECPSPHAGTVQTADGVQILRPPRNWERSASQKARFSRLWTARTSGGGPKGRAVGSAVRAAVVSLVGLCILILRPVVPSNFVQIL